MPKPEYGVGSHRRPEPFHGRHRRPNESPDTPYTSPGKSRSTSPGRSPGGSWHTQPWPIAGALLMVVIVAVILGGLADPPSSGPLTIDAAQALQVRGQEADSASRSARADKNGDETAKKAEKRKKPSSPEPIGWLNKKQMRHAATIVRVGKEMGLPKRAYVVALATAMQESTLRNLANWNLPASLDRKNDGVGSDHDSVGLFQQRPASGWGSVKQCMTPEYAAKAFYRSLRNVPGWKGLPVTVAAQTVQVSAFPGAYAKHTDLARRLVNALT